MLQKGVQYSSDSGICARIRIIYFDGKEKIAGIFTNVSSWSSL